MARGGQSLFYQADGLGSIIDLTNATGNVIQSYVYDSFGNIEQQVGSLINPYTYTGREIDTESGLYFYRARYYDSITGRFINEDPIGFAGGDNNFYRYTHNNPINFIDPSGLFLDTIADIGFIIYDLYNLATDPCNKGENLTALGLDVAGALIPFATGLGAASKAATYGTTAKGRPLTKHYATNTGPKRNIPVSVVDNTIDTIKGIPVKDGKTVYYDPINDVTVVTGDGQSIVSVHRGPPGKGQY